MIGATGSVARAAVLAGACLLAGTACGGPHGQGKSACDRPFRAAEWREVTSGRQQYVDRYETQRRALARDIIACNRLAGKGAAKVRDLLGDPLPEFTFKAGRTEEWWFRLGPDSLRLDNDVLGVVFDRNGRVDAVEIFND